MKAFRGLLGSFHSSPLNLFAQSQSVSSQLFIFDARPSFWKSCEMNILRKHRECLQIKLPLGADGACSPHEAPVPTMNKLKRFNAQRTFVSLLSLHRNHKLTLVELTARSSAFSAASANDNKVFGDTTVGCNLREKFLLFGKSDTIVLLASVDDHETLFFVH